MNIDPVRRQSLISLASNLGLTVVGFGATMYFAHALGAAVYGIFSLFLAYYGILNLIGDGGFGGAAVKRISEGKEQNAYFTAFFFLRVVLLVASVAVVLILSNHLTTEGTTEMIPWLILALVIGAFLGVTANGVYGKGMVGINQTAGFLNNVVKVIIQILAVFLGYGVAGLIGGFIAGMIAGGFFSLYFLRFRLTRFTTAHLKNLFTFSFWIFLASSGATVFSYADTVLIGYFMTDTNVGVYRIAFQFTAAATFTTMALHTTLYPKISRWSTDDSLDRITISLSRAFTYSFFLAVPVAVGGWVLGDRLLYFLYGASFAEGSRALAILLLVQIVNVFVYLQVMYLNAINRPRESFYASGAAGIANILLDIILIPLFGIEGAAIATLVTMMVNAGIAHHYLSKQIPVQLERSSTLHILLAAGVMGLVILVYRIFIPLSSVSLVLAAVALGGLIYGVVLLKTDRRIHDDLRDLVMQLGMPWPQRL